MLQVELNKYLVSSDGHSAVYSFSWWR